MPKIFYTQDEYDSLKYEHEQLKARHAAVEAMRPAWAKGYTSDGVAAQGFSNALYAIWRRLGVADQTSALRVINEFVPQLELIQVNR